MRTNVRERPVLVKNFEGIQVVESTAMQELKRAALTALLFENTFYESGDDIASRVKRLVATINDSQAIANLAVLSRSDYHLRHFPLFLVRELARHEKHRKVVRKALYDVIQRADEIAEFVALYWKEGKQPLANSVKNGLADAFTKFDEYAIAKYDRDNPVKLRDVMFLVHPESTKRGKQSDSTSARAGAILRNNYRRTATRRNDEVLAKLATGTLTTPDTWEVALSAKDGVAKGIKWTRLITEKKLGSLALYRNLRNMVDEGVDKKLIRRAILDSDPKNVLPFRYVAADRASGGQFRDELNSKMSEGLRDGNVKLKGRTIILVDVSGSMDHKLSEKSDMRRMDAAAALAVIGKRIGDDVDVYTFSNSLVKVNNVEGLNSIDRIINSQGNNGTELATSVNTVQSRLTYDRLIVITDEQATDSRFLNPPKKSTKNYMINVAPYRYSVVYGDWISISGFSEAVFRFINEIESADFTD